MEKKINKLIKLVLYKNFALDEIVEKAADLMTAFDRKENLKEKADLYYDVQRLLVESELGNHCGGTFWKNHICKLIAESENAFSLECERGKKRNMFQGIAKKDLKLIIDFYQFPWDLVDQIFQNDDSVFYFQCGDGSGNRGLLYHALEGGNLDEILSVTAEYYEHNGCGVYERYDAFIWNQGLVGTDHYEKMDLSDLIGYELQKSAVEENTEFFIQGLNANNMLLYGDKGTGKSSCVKSMLTKYKDQKLRMIEMSKEGISDFHTIIDRIKDRGLKYIIFIDDLSFEETETSYKHFKSVVEGGLEKQPDNVVIYVTSNRMHLVKETWDERGGSELHTNDAIQEKLSLSDRFGITITFLSPDKAEFLAIVKGIAKRERLNMSEEHLVSEANKWEMRYHGRSGRSAKQLVQYLTSKYGRC